jgi:hypothetical protein
MANKYYGYFADRQMADGQRSFIYSPSLDDVIKQISDGAETVEPKPEPTREAPTEEVDVGLAREMVRAATLGLSHNHLIGVATEIRRSFPTAFIKTKIVKPVTLPEDLVKTHEGVEIFGVTQEQYHQLDHELDSLEHIKEGLNALPGAALMSLVATFDSLIADIVKKMLRLRPERYATSDKQIPIKDVLTMNSMDDFIDVIIEDDAYVFSRGSHEEQVKFIEKNLHVPIISHWKHWPDFIEVFERRNLVAHGEEKFTSRYAANCASAELDAKALVGNRIELSAKYLRGASDILLEFSILLTFVLWRKHFSETEEKSFEQLNQTVFELISHRRYTVARDILEFALPLKGAKMSEVARRMMIVNLASAHRHLENVELSDKTLDDHDWSASSNEFKICVAALKGDVDRVADLFSSLVESKSISNADFRRWPVFDFVRSESKFQEAFEKTFGEPLSRSAMSERTEADAES